MKGSKRVLVLVLLVFFTVFPVAAEVQDSLLSADLPIAYGERLFRERILQRTGGERSPIGLVLSGGSARAFAHIGVLRYLEEQGIVPDFIISNSMGSIVGLLYAAGLSPDQIYDAITDVSIQTLFDLTLPIEGGLLDSSRFVSHFASILGEELDVKDLPIPIIVATEDLVTKRQVLLSEGDIYTVLQASYALPVYFKPVHFRGHLLIDGGITNLVPVDLGFEYADTMIVSTTFYDLDTLNLKDPLTILNVSIDIAKRREGVAQLKKWMDDTIWIRCAVEDVSFMEFSKLDYLVQKGYESARQQAERLRDLPKGDRWASLSAIRADHQVSLAKSSNAYRLYREIPMHNPSHVVGLNIHAIEERQLVDDTALGVGYTFRSGNLNLSTVVGGSVRSFTNEQMGILPSVTAQADYYLFDHFKGSAYTSLLWDIPKKAPVLMAGLAAEGRLYTFSNRLRLSLSETFEHQSSFDSGYSYQYWKDHTFLSTTTVEGALSLGQRSDWRVGTTSLAVSFEFLGDYLAQGRSFLSSRVASEVIYAPMGFYGTADWWGRFALDGNGDVPLFAKDGFRTTNAALKSQGHDLSIPTVNAANHLIGLNLSIGWRPPTFSPSLAELLIFKESSVAIYTDLLFSRQSAIPFVSVGLEVHTDISLLGINSLPLTLYGGWDQSVNGFVWGFWFTLTL